MSLTVDDLKGMYRAMWTIRRFEEAAGQFYQQGLLKGGVHPSIGQEAVAVGACAALRRDDWITSTHRGHGHHIAKGADLGRLMAELLGKATGYCHGHAGSMHMAAFDVGSLGAYPIVASGVPVATGAALSAAMQGLQRVALSFFGDGALGQGVLHESLNLAAVWKLPVVFLCENNGYAVSTPNSQSIAIRDRAAFAAEYGIAGAVVDGQDVLAVHAATQAAVQRARAGDGPSFVECQTCRFEGHYFGEPQLYRSRDEIEEARRSRDPLTRLAAVLTAEHSASVEELRALENEASAAVRAAVEFAQGSPDPAPEQYAEDVYA